MYKMLFMNSLLIYQSISKISDFQILIVLSIKIIMANLYFARYYAVFMHVCT